MRIFLPLLWLCAVYFSDGAAAVVGRNRPRVLMTFAMSPAPGLRAAITDLYGSDYPFANEQVLRAAEAAFAASSFTHQEKEIVRRDNAARLFRTFASRCCGHSHSHG